jgi:hypothetical protein
MIVLKNDTCGVIPPDINEGVRAIAEKDGEWTKESALNGQNLYFKSACEPHDGLNHLQENDTQISKTCKVEQKIRS